MKKSGIKGNVSRTEKMDATIVNHISTKHDWMRVGRCKGNYGMVKGEKRGGQRHIAPQVSGSLGKKIVAKRRKRARGREEGRGKSALRGRERKKKPISALRKEAFWL